MFLPSTHGFGFANDFPHEPVFSVRVPWLGTLGLGDAWYGLCGGMTFALADYWLAGTAMPQTTEAPAPQSELFRYLALRQLDSLDVPHGILRLWSWMASSDGVARTWHESLPGIVEVVRAAPVPVTLLLRHSSSPWCLAHNHQVLVYEAVREEETVLLRVCDPNCPKDDAQSILCRAGGIEWSRGEKVYGLYRTKYEARVPPAE